LVEYVSDFKRVAKAIDEISINQCKVIEKLQQKKLYSDTKTNVEIINESFISRD